MEENKNNMKLPSRSYWEGFKARNESLWDKVKNNTFVNMLFPVKEVSEGNTEAVLPLIVPGIQTSKVAISTVGKPLYVYTAKKLGASIGRGRPASNINEATGLPITMQDITEAIANNGRTVYEGTSEAAIKSQAVRDQANRQANYRAIIEKQARTDARKTKTDWDNKRAPYMSRQKKAIIGDTSNPRLTSYINISKEFQYLPNKSMESNWKRFINEMSSKYHFTESEASDIFNNTFSQYFKSGGKLNYLNYFK